MVMQINTNTSASDAYRELAAAQTSLAQPTVAISSGLASTESVVAADSVDFEGKTRAVSAENTLAAASRLTNSAMAEQMVDLTRASILAQPVTAVSAQANQANSDVLQLLRPAA
ncbi:flagellin C-terminal helical region [Cryobacterium flavum]|uniref:Flagellin C-terminal helical region n=2 Tax=Cryobacterium flavum TaxID=1424659 RepID=A0A4R8UVM5_9MICO|nr:hypothetical protein E3O21_18360 [Cryobacterium flavum]SDN02341.1 flagellin C-terminal helical region [Cryobacterium flavum]